MPPWARQQPRTELAARQLRSEPEIAGLRPGFDIMDADDSRRIAKRVMQAMNLASDDSERSSAIRSNSSATRLTSSRWPKWAEWGGSGFGLPGDTRTVIGIRRCRQPNHSKRIRRLPPNRSKGYTAIYGRQ
jgi:hypothetical protein